MAKFSPAASNFALQIPIKGFLNSKIFAPAAGIERRRQKIPAFVFIKYEFTSTNTRLEPAAGGKFLCFLPPLVDFLTVIETKIRPQRPRECDPGPQNIQICQIGARPEIKGGHRPL